MNDVNLSIVCQVLGVESLLRANLLSMDMILFFYTGIILIVELINYF